MSSEEKPVYRQSGLLNFERCAHRYYLEQMFPNEYTTFTLLRGLAPHEARKENLLQKVRTGVDLPFDDVADAARDFVMETYQSQEVVPEPDQKDLAVEVVRGQAVDLSIKFARGDYEYYQQPMQPKEVELPLEIEMPEVPFKLGMVIDAVDVEHTLSDAKTAKRSPSQDVADQSEQLSLYCMGYTAHAKKPPPKMTLDYTVALKNGTKKVQLVTFPNEWREQAVLRRFMAAHVCIQAGHFPPTASTNWQCGPKYCPFYTTKCPYAIAGKKRLTS